jgi:phospholipid/cholesterol/gamma-HCH transport system ATP-binding protein
MWSRANTCEPADNGCEIVIENLAKKLGGRPVLRDVNLTIPPRATLGILGRSGCGKSVLLKHIIGLMWPDSGRVLINGSDINLMDREELYRTRHRFGMLFQSAALLDSMTVGENVALSLIHNRTMSRGEIADRVSECLSMVGLRGLEDRMPSEMSGGMKKRVGLARAVAMGPEVMLFDEPTTGLDPIMAAVIDQVIKDLVDRLNTTAVVVTHDMRSVTTICDQVAFLHNGIIFAQGTPEEITASEDEVVAQFITGGAEGPLSPLD